jgi:hypothetical protein
MKGECILEHGPINQIHCLRFQVLTAASMKFRVFWDVAPCSHVEVDRRFRGTYLLLPSSSPWWWRQYTPLKRRSTSTWLHGVTSQKTLNQIHCWHKCSILHNRAFSFLSKFCKKKKCPPTRHAGVWGRGDKAPIRSRPRHWMGWVVSVTPRPRFSPGERTPDTRWTEGWVGPRAGLDTEARGKILSPLPGIEPRSPGRPVRSQTLYSLSYAASIYIL